MTNTNKYITQLDYIRVLLEENRIGEAMNFVDILSKGLEKECTSIANTIENNNLVIDKVQLKTKPNNYMYIQDTWVKLLQMDKENISLEVNKNIVVKTTYKVNESNTHTN